MHNDEVQPKQNQPSDDTAPATPPVAGLDYYLERGRLVFTCEYHLNRGYCCRSGCRHCPYEKSGVPGKAWLFLSVERY
ncbi:MAG: hypothetical protein K2Y37_22470 [Pirellulales bacterium]|nr:hypothetical protein [Pirellulales bacterium]